MPEHRKNKQKIHSKIENKTKIIPEPFIVE
jgi:hypothetical protein